MKRLLCKILCFAALLPLLCSCKTTNLGYFTDTAGTTDGIVPVHRTEIKIEPNDELLINVTSAVPEASAVYNLPLNNPISAAEITMNSSNSKMQTYVVNKDGYINFPILGKIHVKGMTTMQLAEYLTNRIAAEVEDPYVRVEIVNFEVRVMGEVARPGSYKITNERVTVMDALAKAGDMTIYGRRDNVTVWREEDGEYQYHVLNLKDSKVISSPYYYLKQNDVVYVEPSSSRGGQADYNQTNSYRLSMASSIISGCSVIATLMIALFIK